MEKNSLVKLTREELKSFQGTGTVPARLVTSWQLSADDLKQVIRDKGYELIN